MKKLYVPLFLYLLLSFTGVISAQEIRLRKGAVNDSVTLQDSLSTNFAMYIPSNYNEEKKWAVIFAFDPEGRGRSTAQLFRTAAEQQGYLIAAANFNLKDDSISNIVQKASKMVNGVLSSFPIHEDMIYAAGMEEGAQVASTLPIFYKNIAGILAIGNSFVNPKYIDKENPYMFIGLAGTKDYMVYEMERYLKFYDEKGFKTEVDYFEGMEKEWPEAAVINNAVTGFTLQAISNSKRENDLQFIKELFESELEYTEILRRSRNYYDAYTKLERMEEKYEAFGFKDTIEDRLKAIKDSDFFKNQRKDFRQATLVEKQYQGEYEYLLETDLVTINFENIGWWAYQMDELQKLKENSKKATSNMAFRLHGYLDYITKNRFNSIQNSKAPIDLKIFISVLRTVIDKENPEAYFKIISLAAGDGDYETALLYLEDLLKTGYKNMDALYAIDGTLDLQLTQDYNEIIKKYLGESKYYN